jgi:hypothetical protein
MDIEKLKALALAAGDWTPPAPYEEDRSYSDREIRGLEFCAAANPATVLELIAEVARLRADAGRYRWLRDEARAEYEERIFVTSDGHKDYYEPSGIYETELDDAVDKAIEKEKAEKDRP